VKTVSDKVVRHLLAYTTVPKLLVVYVPFYLKFWPKMTHPFKTPISNQYSLVAPQPQHLAKKFN